MMGKQTASLLELALTQVINCNNQTELLLKASVQQNYNKVQ